jgi:hypothetical protein
VVRERREARGERREAVGDKWRARTLQPIEPPLVLHDMLKFLLWCLLLVFCWPLALLAIVLYPLVWILLLPFRIVGIAVDGVLGLLRGLVFLPARLLGGRA